MLMGFKFNNKELDSESLLKMRNYILKALKKQEHNKLMLPLGDFALMDLKNVTLQFKNH